MTKQEKKAYKAKLKQLNERVKRYTEYMEENYIEVDAKEVMNKNTFTDAIDGMEEDNKYIPYKDDVEIIIINALPTQQTLVKNKIETGLVSRLYEIETSLKRLHKKILVTFLLGVVFLSINVVLNYLKIQNYYFTREIASIASWVFMWTTVEKFYFDRHDLLHKKSLIERMFFAVYSFEHKTRDSLPTL